MTLAMKIARVLNEQERYPVLAEIEEWDREIAPWKARLDNLYEGFKATNNFSTSSRLARAAVVEEIMKGEGK